uniref:Tetraspanin n=1 Tax=Trichuris muris TaxID=70415 RepID=A0A5S6QQ83_TRIMR
MNRWRRPNDLVFETDAENVVERKVRSPTYRIWLYGYCIILLPVVIACPVAIYFFLQLDWMQVFPFDHLEFHWIYLYASTAAQVGILLLCMYGVFRDRILLLHIFWTLSLITLICDLAFAAFSVIWWNNFITSSGEFILSTLGKARHGEASRIDENASCSASCTEPCDRWSNIQTQLQCCGVENAEDYDTILYRCQPLINSSNLPFSCCANEQECNVRVAHRSGCLRPLLQWMNQKKDVYLNLPICLLMCYRIIGLVLLRSEIRQLSSEIHARESNSANALLRAFSIDYTPFGSPIRKQQPEVDSPLLSVKP